MGTVDATLARQNSLPGFQSLQGGTPLNLVRGPFLRGMLTLKAMETLPVSQHPELSMNANYWAPVQAYYACHGLGLAIIAALRLQPPRDHRRFLSIMSSTQVLPRLFPAPFNTLCLGDVSPSTTVPVTFSGVPHAVADVVSASNLQNPTSASAPLLTTKSVYTTRRWWLDRVFDRQREERRRSGRSRGNLDRAAKRRLAGALHGTSILDFIYRMRVRTNYDDPEMFVYGQTDRDTAVQHYENLVTLVQGYARLAQNIIKRKIGGTQFLALMALAS